MRLNDLTVRLISPQGRMSEQDDGRVFARPGMTYRIRLRNHDPNHRMVLGIDIDGRRVTESGLVLDPGAMIELERPLYDSGLFTVFAEGNEEVFGEDGGRGNPDLGLIEVTARKEVRGWRPPPPSRDVYTSFMPLSASAREPFPLEGDDSFFDAAEPDSGQLVLNESISHVRETAAGTGLTGQSSQRFVDVEVGPLEEHATVIRLRLVIAPVTGADRPRPLSGSAETPVPPRPIARP
jgi:hypothetical protein